MFRFLIALIDALVWPLFLVTLIWLAFFVNHGYHLGWNQYGMQPGEAIGFLGVLTMPFLHANVDHLFSNSIPLLLSLGFIFLYFKQIQWRILWQAYLGSGVLLWFLASGPSNHIGASGLVYAFIAFLVTHALLNRNKETSAAALVLIFLYGSLIYGIFPEYGLLVGKNISWEGHLSGMIMGVLLAWVYRRKGPQRKRFFEDEEEDDDQDDEPWYPQQMHDGERKIYRYHYRPRSPEE